MTPLAVTSVGRITGNGRGHMVISAVTGPSATSIRTTADDG